MAEPAKKADAFSAALDEWKAAVIREAAEAARAAAREEVAALATATSANTQDANLTTTEAAKFLSITPAALRKHVKRGNIAPAHRGNRGNGLRESRFSMRELQRFLKRGTGNAK